MPPALYHPAEGQVQAAHAFVGKVSARVRDKLVPVAVRLMDEDPEAMREENMHPQNVEFFKALAGTQMMQVHYEKLEQELSRVQQRGTPVV